MQARTWRRGWHAAWLAITALTVVLAVACTAPQSAHAAPVDGTAGFARCYDCVQTVAAPLNYTGWTQLNLNYCPAGRACAAIYRMSTQAWRWNAQFGWIQTSLRGGQWVYVAPFDGSFRWAWTQETGWLAVSGGRFEIQSALRTVQPLTN